MFKNLKVKLLAMWIKKKLDLQEGPMTEGKPWWKSKTIWACAVATLISVYQTVDTNLAQAGIADLPDIPNWVYTFLGTIGVWGRMDAKSTIKS